MINTWLLFLIGILWVILIIIVSWRIAWREGFAAGTEWMHFGPIHCKKYKHMWKFMNSAIASGYTPGLSYSAWCAALVRAERCGCYDHLAHLSNKHGDIIFHFPMTNLKCANEK